MDRGLIAVALALLVCGVPAEADDARAVQIGTFADPTYVAVAPGRPHLLFIVERAGQIQVLRDEQTLARPFLDIRNIVRGPPDAGAGNEQGLLSMAFPPDYASSGRFYVAFTDNNGSLQVNEFMRSASPVRADRGSRRILLTIPHPGADNHNGGQLQFDSNGRLYISTGDGGNVDPRGDKARRLSSLLGKILRIDPRPGATRPYRIPPGNPFVGLGGRDEIFAYGLRHPWRFSLDGGRIAIADVGQTQREEVNLLTVQDAAGANFGWPEFEGDLVFDPTRPGPHLATPPMFVYSHDGGGCAIIGGYVVRDTNLPGLLRRYLYGDACTGEIRSFVPRVADQQALRDRPTGLTLPGLSSFGQGFNGKIYAAQIGGPVWRLEPPLP
jgi:glucose/arabinose dehydrogenase